MAWTVAGPLVRPRRRVGIPVTENAWLRHYYTSEPSYDESKY